MNRWTYRTWLGAGLVLLGILMLLERAGLFHGAVNILWGLVFLALGGWFLSRFAAHMRSEWWAAIPGAALVGIAASALSADVPALDGWSGSFFLGALGLGFFAVYFSGRERWWAVIPGGLFITLAAIAVLSDVYGAGETGGFFFLGLGLTFLLLALLTGLSWAWIPGVALLVMGFLIGTPWTGNLDYVWPAALILGGVLLIVQFLRRPR